MLDYRSVVEFRTIGNLRCVVQGAKYFYLYYVRACAPSKETLLKRTEAKQNVHGMALTEEEAKKAKSGIAAWPVNVLTSCQAGPRCGAQCWKPLCRECFNAYYESHQDAERFMVGGSMSGTLVDATRRCAFTYGNGEACDDVPAPTCNGFCFRHREHGGLVLLPTHAEVVQTILEKTPKNVPAAIAGLICDFAAPFKQ